MTDSTNGNGNSHAPYVLLQAVTETSLELLKLLGLQSTGQHIAKQLGSTENPIDALAQLEMGMDNLQISPSLQVGRLVCLKHCPFQAAINKFGPWSEHAKRMVERFNQSPRGGAALHPICVSHLAVRDAFGGVNLGCRSTTSGKIAVSTGALLNEVGVSEEQVRTRLEGNACLYWIK